MNQLNEITAIFLRHWPALGSGQCIMVTWPSLSQLVSVNCLWFRFRVCHCQCEPTIIMLIFCFQYLFAAIWKDPGKVICQLWLVICHVWSPNVAVTETIHKDVEEHPDDRWRNESMVSCLQAWGCDVGDEPVSKLDSALLNKSKLCCVDHESYQRRLHMFLCFHK